ncbi:hypothetical protein [Vibrio fluminensis]|uniref:hypothetical protein n=1 Tax=Vibrio fluminensis TaxID=2783614 RepID=UPI001887175D|nr:hypothetical protein [Vibrio fluminensis]
MRTSTFLLIVTFTLIGSFGFFYYINQSEPIIRHEYEREPEFEWSISNDGIISADRKVSIIERTYSFRVVVDNGNVKVLASKYEKTSLDDFCSNITNEEPVSVEPFLINDQAVKMVASCDYPYWVYEAETQEGKEYVYNSWINDYSVSYQGVWSAYFYPSGLKSIIEKAKKNRATSI